MGQLARQRVFQSRGPKTNDRLILLALADFTPDDRYTCYPSVQTLAEMSGMSDRQAQRIIAGLREQGHIDLVMGRGRNNTTRYAVLVGLSDEEVAAAMIELKGDIAMSPIPTQKGDIKGDTKHDIAMSPFITEKVTDLREKVTDRAVKGDIAMSPEQNEQSKQKSIVASADATPPTEKKPTEPPTPASIRTLIADLCSIDLDGKTASRGQVTSLNAEAKKIWTSAKNAGKSEADCLEAIRYVAGWIKRTVYPYSNGQPLTPGAIRGRWRAAMDAKPKPTAYLNGHTNGTHAPAEPTISLEEQRRRTAEAASKYPALKLPGGAQ